jgi:hypothetical protein
MAQPTRSDVHVNRPLGNVSIAYIQKAPDFVASKVFPVVPVMKQSDLYFTYDKEYWRKTAAEKRAPATESAGSGFRVNSDNKYFCDVWAVHQDVDDQTRANADQPLDLDRDATLFVTQQLLLRRELQFFKQYFTTGIWSADVTPTTKWDASGSDPMQDVDTQKSVIKQNTTVMPNVMVVTTDVFFALRNNAAVLDRIKYTQRGVVSEDLLATLFGVDKFLVASASVNTAPQGQAGAFQYIGQKQVLLCYANPNPSILQPSAGYIFSWQGAYGAGAEGNRIMTFRIEPRKCDRIEGEMAFDMHLVGSDLGVLFTAVVS